MAVTSPLTPLGSALPVTTLPDLDGREVDLAALAAGTPLLVVFACNHCPYVKHVESALGALISEYPADRLTTVAIGSNDVARYPDDDVPQLREQVARAGWTFGYLVDGEQTAAKAFGAVCTPDFFLYDAEHRLAYRGAFDASTPGNNQPLTGEELRAAIDAVLAGSSIPEPHRPAMGCSIKWKGE
jgi:cytochrome oxidase Cu insertion factor (SCO1/SenC/PrrC family)